MKTKKKGLIEWLFRGPGPIEIDNKHDLNFIVVRTYTLDKHPWQEKWVIGCASNFLAAKALSDHGDIIYEMTNTKTFKVFCPEAWERLETKEEGRDY